MSRKAGEQLLDRIGEVEERFILEYLEAKAEQNAAAGEQPGSRKRKTAGRPSEEEPRSADRPAREEPGFADKRAREDPGSADKCVREEPGSADIAAKKNPRRRGPLRGRFAVALAAAMTMLFGTVCFAAAPVIGHFLEDLRKEDQIIMRNFDEIEKEYGTFVGQRQECGGVVGTLNSAALEDHYLLLSYTFDWSGLEEAEDGSFHTWFLPWFFYITEGDNVICKSEYTRGLHVQGYTDGGETNPAEATNLYCIDLGELDGASLVGKELTVRLLYAEEGEGFVSSFTPESFFAGRSWRVDSTDEFQGHRITLREVRESALYVTLFIDCEDIGHPGDELTFLLSDEQGNAYAAYPYGDVDEDGYWFTKPEEAGGQLILKVIRRGGKKTPAGVITDDSYEVLREIPIKRKR